MAAQDYSVLIVDHNDVVRERIVRHLDSLGYCVIQCSTAVSALTIAAAQEPDAILCNLKLLSLDGTPLLQLLARDLSVAPVIALSDSNEIDEVLGALRSGACDYINTSALEIDVLDLSVARASDQGALRRENREYRERLEQANSELKTSLRALRQDQQAGRHVQLKMLPPDKKQIGNFTLSHRIVPSLLLSGDFVEYFTVGSHHLVFFIADVSGHGASSAFVTVLLKNLFARKRSDYGHQRDNAVLSPVQMLRRANLELLNTQIGKHVTMCVGVIDQQDNTLCYSVAGHLPLPILTSHGKAQFLEGEGMPVGLFADASYSEQTMALPQEFLLTLFSDGILETLTPDGVIAKESALLECLSRPELDSIEKLSTVLGIDKIDEAPDDIAVLLVSRVSN